jgi:hypothetical protein
MLVNFIDFFEGKMLGQWNIWDFLKRKFMLVNFIDFFEGKMLVKFLGFFG